MNKIIDNWRTYLFLESKKDQISFEDIRIHIANEIDMTLMRPTVNIGDPNDMMIDFDEEGNRFERPFGKEDSTFLLYLYRGFDEEGNLSNEENIQDVNSELNNRANNFLYQLDKEDMAVFIADFDKILDFVSGNKKDVEEESYQTMYMAKKAPGKFTTDSFARRNRAIYKDTYTYGGGVDFMFKKTKELKNINPQHLFLFKLENLLGRVKNKILNGETEIAKDNGDVQDIVELSKTVPTLNFKDWHANYREGVTNQQIQTEIDQIKPVYQQGSVVNYFTFKENELLRLLYNTHKQGKSSPIYSDKELMNQFFETVQVHMSSLLNDQEKQLQNKSYPTLLMRMSMMFDKDMIPRSFFDEDNYNFFMKLREYIKEYNQLDEYSFIFPLDPEEVPKEIRNQTTEKDVKDKRKLRDIKEILNDISTKISTNSEISLEQVQKLFDLAEEIPQNFKKELRNTFEEFDLTTDIIVDYLSKNSETSKEKEPVQQFEKKLDQLEDAVYSDKELTNELFADFIKSMENLKLNNKLKPYSERINKLFDYLEGK
jgi:hypothetical protein|tara:strand:+ start:1249 stop:2874 length:1626 start_codon:yes stop_codon:yes gene_type:complete